MPITPNAFAWFALAVWPLVALVAYALGRTRLTRTTAWMMLLPWMFLPSSITFNSPLIKLNKDIIGLLSVAIGLLIFGAPEPKDRASSRLFARVVFVGLAISAAGTVITNPEGLVYGPRVIPGLTLHDWVSIVASLFVSVYLPFVIGQRVFRTRQDLLELFRVLSLASLIYLPLCLLEIRLSPQLHYWIYGYYPSAFIMTMRYGGFRPTVFMTNGLHVSMLMFAGFCATLALSKGAPAGEHPMGRLRAAVLGVGVLALKSFGALVYSFVAVLVHFAFSRKAMRLLLAIVVLTVIAYPTVRSAKLIPMSDVVGFFGRFNPERAESLAYRLRNEDMLLIRAQARPAFGWGTWGRNRIYQGRGVDISVTDGDWIIRIGSFGYIGFLGFYLLLIVPVLRYIRWCPQMTQEDQVLVGMLAVIVALLTLDLLPNSLPGFFTIALAGALHGIAQRARSASAKSAKPVFDPRIAP